MLPISLIRWFWAAVYNFLFLKIQRWLLTIVKLAIEKHKMNKTSMILQVPLMPPCWLTRSSSIPPSAPHWCHQVSLDSWLIQLVPAFFLAIFSEMFCFCLFLTRAELEWMAQGQPATFMPKVSLELTVSWFLACCFNHYTTLAPNELIRHPAKYMREILQHSEMFCFVSLFNVPPIIRWNLFLPRFRNVARLRRGIVYTQY